MRIFLLILFNFFCLAFKAQTCVSIVNLQVNNNDQVLGDCTVIPMNSKTCFNLKVDFPTYNRTNNYTVESIPFNGDSPYISFNSGTPINPNADDEFVSNVKLPFKFCFFNTSYSEFVVGSNGSISFNTEQLGYESFPNFNDTDLNLNSIFAGMSDLVFSSATDSNIYYSVIGAAPCRKFIINFYKGRLSNCQESVTSQIVLHEGSNEIEIFVKDKPLACSTAKYSNSVIGIKNNNPNNPITIFPPNRNVGEWSTSNEAWKFKPNGSVVSPKIEWLDAQNRVVGRNATFEICPQPFSSYSVRLTYNNCDEDMVYVKNFSFMSDTLLTDKIEICDVNSDKIENNYQLSLLDSKLVGSTFRGSLTYFTTQANAEANINPVRNFNLTSNSQLWVRVTTGNCSTVFGPITIQLKDAPLLVSSINVDLNVCDINFNQSETYDFSQFNELITKDPSLQIKYYRTLTDASNGTSLPLTLIYEGQYSVFAKVTNQAGCFSIVEVKLNVTFSKVEAEKKTIYVCFDGEEDKTFDLLIESEGMLIDPLEGVKIQFFEDFNSAMEGTADLEISNIQTITDDGDVVSKSFWVRFTEGEDCFTVRELKIVLLHPVPTLSLINVCDTDNDLNETFNPNKYSRFILGTLDGKVSYFNTQKEAEENTPILNSLTIQDTKEFWIRIESHECVEIYPIHFTLVKVPSVNKEVVVTMNDVCDNNNDGVEKFNITQYQSQIYNGTEKVTFNYYLGYNAQTGEFSKEVPRPSDFEIGKQNIIYVKTSFANACASVTALKININFLAPIVVKPTVLKKCSFDSSASVQFDLNEAIPLAFDQSLNQINLSNLKVEFYHTNNEANIGNSALALPNLYTGTQTLEIAWIRFTNVATGCYSIAEVHLETYLPPKTTLHTLTVCDNNNDGYFEVDLLAEKERYVLNYQDYFIYSFYTSEQDALKGAPENAITNPKDYQLANVQDRVWVRVESIVGCASVVPITFNAGVKLQLQQYGPFIIDDVCDINNDSVEIINLTRFENVILSGSKFEYFESKEDLIQGTSISNPSAYTYNQNEGKQFYVRVSKTGYCPEFISITVSLKQTSMFVIPETFICPFEGSVDVSPTYSGAPITNYEWKNASGQIIGNSPILYNVTAAGEYSLKVIANGGCETYQNFTIKNYDIPEITSLLPSGSSYKVVAKGDSSKTIVYSKDKVTWQSSDTFSNLPPGVVTFYVKYEGEDCLSFPKQGIMPDIQNVITPNSDGKNDVWKLKDLHVFNNENSTITIFDRYQKSLYQQSSNTELTWDGTYNGRPLSTDSYWYVIKLPDGRVFTGWILLKNRN